MTTNQPRTVPAAPSVSTDHTDEAVERVRRWVEFHTANHGGNPRDRTGASYTDYPLLVSDIRLLVERAGRG